MRIGFIGAGKVAFAFGKYLTERGADVSGYYNRDPRASLEAAEFTDTRQYVDLNDLVEDSDLLFLAVSDGAVAAVWEQLKMLPVQNKIICHFSGSLSSAVFSDIERYHAYGYSIHPLFAVNDRYNSHKELSGAFFTIEGHPKYLDWFREFLEGLGNRTETIAAADKMRYHAAAAMASNLYVGMVHLCEEMLQDCGFSPENAHRALAPLIAGNAENIVRCGTAGALTGPVERNDLQTVREHLDCLRPEERTIYRCLSEQVLRVAGQKHPERDYEALKEILQG